MAGWYRRPKRLDLHRVIHEPGMAFVIETSQSSAEMIVEIHSCCRGRIALERFQTRTLAASIHDRILLCCSESTEEDWDSRLAEGWRGIIYLPPNKLEREKVLRNFFSVQRRYRLGRQCSNVHLKSPIQPFVLDLSISPGVITNVRAA